MSNDHSSEVVYRDIFGFPGYKAGSDGSIWSCWTQGKGACPTPFRRHRLLARPDQHGRYFVMLLGPKRQCRVAVHRLVLLAFVGPCPDGQESRHLNDCPADNRASNLAWGTRADNQADKVRNGKQLVGSKVGNAKLTEATVASILADLLAGRSRAELARQHDVTWATIDFIRKGRTWKHVPRPARLPQPVH